MKYTLFPVLLLLLTGVKALAQPPKDREMLDLTRDPGQLLLSNPENSHIMYELDTATGKRLAIRIGSFLKVWYRSDKVRWFSQPLARTDFNKHTYFVEARLSAVTDSSLLFMKAPPPFPFGLFLKRKGGPRFDTVPISKITKIRSFSSGAMNAYRNASMMPTMSFVPTSINGYNTMIFLPSVTGLIFTGFSDMMYPMHRVKNNKGQYQLSIEKVPVDSSLFVELNGVDIDHEKEWDIDRHDRWEKLFTRLWGYKRDSLLMTNENRVILSFTYGARMFPPYAIGEKDSKTGVNIAARTREYGFVSERFIGQHDRVGVEVLIQPVKADMSTNPDGTSMRLGAGNVISTYSFYKFDLGGLFGQKYRTHIQKQIMQYNPHSTDPEVQNSIYDLLRKLVGEPHAYALFGLGAVNTNLFRVRVGQQGTSISTADYTQKKFAIEGGGGVYSRLGKRLVADMGVKYTWTSGYTPPLGGIISHNSWKIQFNFGWITNSGFAKTRKRLEEQLN